ncbi:MAG: M20 family peptidase [Candidatus Abyssobacteria bacterium SURF_5]|uniref:Probable succinyl-diaminopimelate desuccinylase n=1 Tax=Abyssobacteria bacterium (strain SURF_5) TaxID=2093360 RepID=A0A3A4NGC9_ABYX5|nr:MAG: M20 family peptidase [Candidatus Abyssubacteria bacterium SURF_5]
MRTSELVEQVEKTTEAMADEVVDFLIQLVKAQSFNPPGDTTPAANVVREAASQMKGDLEIHAFDDLKPNIVLRVGRRGGKSLCFNSHMDTVPVGDSSRWKFDPFGGEIAGGNVYGRGSADAKGCAAAMLMAALVLERMKLDLNGELDIAIVSDEETGGALGTQYLLEKEILKPDFAVIGEITSNRVAIAEKGLLVFTLNTHGRTAHASTPWEGVSAIRQMLKLAREIEEALESSFKNKRHPLTPPPSFNFGIIEGGIAINVVPDNCRLTLDRRCIPGESLEEAEREIGGILQRLKAQDPSFEADYTILHRANAFETPADSPLVKSAGYVCSLLDLNPEPIGYQQVSDGRFFADRGILTMLLGPGVAELAHTPDEHVPVNAIIEATKLYALLAIELLGS